MISVEAETRARVLDRLRVGDIAFRYLTGAAAVGVLLLLSGVIVSLIQGSYLALSTFGFNFLIDRCLESGHRKVWRGGADLRNIDYVPHRHADRGPGRADDRVLSHRTLPTMAAPTDRHRHRVARRHSEHHLRDLGTFRLRPVSAADAATVPDQNARQRPDDRAAVCRTALRHRHAHGGPDPGHHGAAVCHFDLARCVRGGPGQCSRKRRMASAARPGKSYATWCCLMRGSASSVASCSGSGGRSARPWRSPSSSATRIGSRRRCSRPAPRLPPASPTNSPKPIGDLYSSALIALGLILFVITFIVLGRRPLHAAAHRTPDRMTP